MKDPSRSALKPLLFLLRHYPPDAGALSYRMEHAAKVLARDYPVRVVSAQPNRYSGVSSSSRFEKHRGVEIHRVWHGRLFKGRGKVARGAAEILGAIWMTLMAVTRYRRSTAVFVSTPPLFCSFPAWMLHKLTLTPLVVDVRDLWLDWAEESGVIRSAILLKLLKRYERSLLCSAKHITVTTKSFKRLICKRFSIAPERITVIYNGLDEVVQHNETRPQAATGKGNGLRRVLYAGNMGPSQNVLGILDGCISSLRKWQNLEIIFIGEGLQWSAVKAQETDRLQVMQRIDREELREFYEDADAFLLHLADLKVYQHTVPSKLFEFVSYGKPLLCGVTGEARDLCRQYTDCYEFSSDDPKSFARAVDLFMQGERPDNLGTERADRWSIQRSSRDFLWKQVLAVVCDRI